MLTPNDQRNIHDTTGHLSQPGNQQLPLRTPWRIGMHRLVPRRRDNHDSVHTFRLTPPRTIAWDARYPETHTDAGVDHAKVDWRLGGCYYITSGTRPDPLR